MASAKLDLAGDGFFHLVDLLESAKAGLPDEVPAPLDSEFREHRARLPQGGSSAAPAGARSDPERILVALAQARRSLRRVGPGRPGSRPHRGRADGLLPRGLSLRRAREPGSPQRALVRGQDPARRLGHAVQPDRSLRLAARPAGAERLLRAPRRGEVSLEHGPRDLRAGRPHPLSGPPPATPRSRRRSSPSTGHGEESGLWRPARSRAQIHHLLGSRVRHNERRAPVNEERVSGVRNGRGRFLGGVTSRSPSRLGQRRRDDEGGDREVPPKAGERGSDSRG